MLHCGPSGGYGLQPPVDTPLANLAMGNIFFILQGLSCATSPNRAVLLKLIGKKGYENQFWARGKLLHWSLGEGITACSHQAPKNC